jgi:polyhydroxybutyrate depolymerase
MSAAHWIRRVRAGRPGRRLALIAGRGLAIFIIVLGVGGAGALVCAAVKRHQAAALPPTPPGPLTQAGDHQVALPGWPNRDYVVHLPPGYTAGRAYPLVLMFHGGGPANAGNTLKTTCPDGDVANPKCMDGVADRAGFAVVYPAGMADPGRTFMKVRTWNGGGGRNGYTCISGYSCKEKIDDVGYVRTVLDDLDGRMKVDHARVFAAGISNGGAMVHRLGCQLADRIAAIAPVSEGNQFSTSDTCQPAAPVAVLEFHGTEDPIAPFAGGFKKTFDSEGNSLAGRQSAADWAKRDGCGEKSTAEDLPGDGKTTIKRETWAGCRGGTEVVFYTIGGGGHTWPGGFQYLPEMMVGKTTRAINANELMIDFFERHPRR